jgi:hypothetical protein
MNYPTRILAGGLILATVLASLGCTTTPSKWPKRSKLSPAQWDRLAEIAEHQYATSEASKSGFSGATWHLGDLPAVNSVIPLISPSGTRIAVSIGQEPSMTTRLAMPGAPVPEKSSVAIWEILPGRGGLREMVKLDAPLLLTDSGDETGFLVERPNADGSRWIGKVDWFTGDLEWLVAEDVVAAFPSISRTGRLAWSERAIDGKHFDLVIRYKTDVDTYSETVVPHADGDWLFPSWSKRSDRLSAFRLTPLQLSLFSMNAETPDGLHDDLRSISVMAGARPSDALLASLGRHQVQGTPSPPLEEVFFYDPRQQRMMLWMPTGINWDQPMMLADQSVAAIHDDRGGFLLTMPDGLYWQDLNDHRKLLRIDLTPWIARPTNDPMRPFLLLQIANDHVTVQAMRPDRNRSDPARTAGPIR